MSLELENVSLVVGGETHIHPTNLCLEEGAFNVLLGTTLAGKTSLMRIMAGLEKPTKGRVIFQGKDVTRQRVRKRNVAMVYQQFINYPNFTVYDNIASPMKLMGKSAKDIDTALARALVKKAKLVLLDEPLANLDYKLREELREELPKLFIDSGATVVYATTEPTEALLLGGHTATLHEGRVTQFGVTAQVYRNPVDALSASVFSDPPMNLGSVTKTGSEFRLDSGACWQVHGDLSALQDGAYTVGVRPHHLSLQKPATDSVPVTGEVLLTEISGSESTVHAVVGDKTWISLNHGVHGLDKGQEVPLYIDTRHCLFFNNSQERVGGGE